MRRSQVPDASFQTHCLVTSSATFVAVDVRRLGSGRPYFPTPRLRYSVGENPVPFLKASEKTKALE